jgi:hypothetical protein
MNDDFIETGSAELLSNLALHVLQRRASQESRRHLDFNRCAVDAKIPHHL